MPRYIIERDLPGAGAFGAEQLRGITQKCADVLAVMGSSAHWDHSYIAEDKIYCVYVAHDPSELQRHADLGGLPISAVRRVVGIIDPHHSEGLTPPRVFDVPRHY